MMKVNYGTFAALANSGSKVFDIQGLAPIVVIAESLKESGHDSAVALISAYLKGFHGGVLSTNSTQVSDEDTAYNGNNATLLFTGEALDNTPILPRSVTVKPATGGNTVNLIDRDGDGILYTDDDDEDEAGSVDYFTGDINLSFPTGKAPNTGDIDCDYKHEDEALAVSGRKSFIFESLNPTDILVINACCKQGSVPSVKLFVEVAVSGKASG